MLCRYIVWFIIMSFVGWVYETTAMTIWEGKWDNRGFLYSPICPIYGIGFITIFYMREIFNAKGIVLDEWFVFFFSMIGSAILEFTTSTVLEKLFHATWWDYSTVPLNIQGRVCLPASIAFGIAGYLAYFYGYDMFIKLIGIHSDTTYTVLALLSIALLSADITATSITLASFNGKLKSLHESINEKAENAVEKVLKDRAAKDAIADLVENSKVSMISRNISFLQKRALKRVSTFKFKNPVTMKNALMLFKNIGLSTSKVKLIVKNRLDRTKDFVYNRDDNTRSEVSDIKDEGNSDTVQREIEKEKSS